MRFFFADDSKQKKPTRQGMEPLIAIGGISVPGSSVRNLEISLDEICKKYGFPDGEEFKWSPDRSCWMHSELIGEQRRQFIQELVQASSEAGAKSLVVIEEIDGRRVTAATSPETDLTNLFIERVDQRLADLGEHGIVIIDRPGGNRANEVAFLLESIKTIQDGTRWVKFEQIALSVLVGDSRMMRLLQLADVVTASTLAYVAGETRYSPPIFEAVREMLYKRNGIIGGIGLKLWPEEKYANLYHWLVGDSNRGRMYSDLPLPSQKFPYANDPDTW